MTTITIPRAVVEQALEALEIGYEVAKAEADRYHTAMAGFRPERHAQMDAEVQQIAQSITALRSALKLPQETPWRPWKPLELGRGCQACGIGADGKAYGYVCPRGDCPTRITCGGAV